MADKEQNSDEYEYAELDTFNPEPESEEIPGMENAANAFTPGPKPVNVRRNAMIVIGLFLAVVIVWKFVGLLFSGSKSTDVASPMDVASAPVSAPPVVQPVQPATPLPTPVTSQPLPTAVSVAPAPDSALVRDVNQKLSALELGQNSTRQEVSAVTGQLESIGTNMQKLTAHAAAMQKMIESLAATVEEQSREIAVLTARTAPKVRPVAKTPSAPRVVYYIQAVIPGRAWLVSSTGNTLTVREGTPIPGLGVVRLIDAQQGRVVLSSGQVIRFSQQDS